jgi:hypothetical protein
MYDSDPKLRYKQKLHKWINSFWILCFPTQEWLWQWFMMSRVPRTQETCQNFWAHINVKLEFSVSRLRLHHLGKRREQNGKKLNSYSWVWIQECLTGDFCMRKANYNVVIDHFLVLTLVDWLFSSFRNNGCISTNTPGQLVNWTLRHWMAINILECSSNALIYSILISCLKVNWGKKTTHIFTNSFRAGRKASQDTWHRAQLAGLTGSGTMQLEQTEWQNQMWVRSRYHRA